MDNLKVISLGLGQPSTTLYFMSSFGEVERADYAIFADTGAEADKNYEYLEWLLKWADKNEGIPIIVTGKKTIYEDLIHGTKDNPNRFSSIPAYTKDDNDKIGILKRQCTDDYKVSEVNKAIREIHGLRKYQHTPKTELWLGITIEEVERVKYPRYKWQVYVYPFCNIKTHNGTANYSSFNTYYNRSNCISWLERNNLPVPPTSTCYFCPFQSNYRWLELKKNRPKEWEKAVLLDKQIRDSSDKGIKYPIYLHRSGVPLDEVDLNEHQSGLFISECEGFCGL